MARKSSKSALIEEFNRKRQMVTQGMRQIFLKMEGRRIKPYSFALARDGGFCIFLKGGRISQEDLEKVQGISKQGNFLIYIATQKLGYIVKPDEIKVYEGPRAQRFRELVSEEISKFHMRFLNL